jgi:predicted dehydrogenase
MTVVIEYDGGRRTATVLASMLGIRAPNVVQVIGTRGSVTSLDRRTLQIVRHEGVRQPGFGPPPALATRTVETGGGAAAATGAMLDHFADLIAGRATAQRGATLREGMWAVAVTEAMTRAAAEGRRVPLDTVR